MNRGSTEELVILQHHPCEASMRPRFMNRGSVVGIHVDGLRMNVLQ